MPYKKKRITTKSKKKSISLASEKVVTEAASNDSRDVKYRVTFLMDQKFMGEYRAKGTSIEVDHWVYEAYKRRKNMLKFDLIQ